MLISLRDAMMAGKRLPYDAEVEYLESTGTQWIDTGVPANSSFTNTIVASFSEYYSDYRCSLVGAGRADNTPSNRICTYYGEWTAWFGASFRRSNVKIVIDEKHECSWGRSGFYIDGTLKYTGKPSDISESIYLFCYNNIYNRIPSGFVKAKIDSFNIKDDNDETLLDLIPVRFTNELGVSEGAMYDRANPTVGMNPGGSARGDGLYRNRGTGAFLIGPDKSAVRGGV